MKRTMAAIGVAVVMAGVTMSVQAQGVAQPSGPTMDQTKAWLESDGRELLRVDRLQTDQFHFAFVAGTDAVETLTLNDCILYWRTVAQSHVTVRSQTGRPTTRTYDVQVPLEDVRGVQVVPDALLNDVPVYKVQLSIQNHPGGVSSTFSINSGNPVLIRSASLPVQTPEDGQRIANAISHAAALCGVELGGGVF